MEVDSAFNDSLDDVDGATFDQTRYLLLCGLAVDAQLAGAALEEFLAKVRARADDWINRPSPGQG